MGAAIIPFGTLVVSYEKLNFSTSYRIGLVEILLERCWLGGKKTYTGLYIKIRNWVSQNRIFILYYMYNYLWYRFKPIVVCCSNCQEKSEVESDTNRKSWTQGHQEISNMAHHTFKFLQCGEKERFDFLYFIFTILVGTVTFILRLNLIKNWGPYRFYAICGIWKVLKNPLTLDFSLKFGKLPL